MINKFLPLQTFKNVVKNSPLTALDLIIFNDENKILLGKRNNAPAKDYYFVPGGRIFKEESLSEALERISYKEICVKFKKSRAKFIGLYEHFYNDNIFNDPNISTHYIVIAVMIKLLSSEKIMPDEQNENFIFMTKKELLNSNKVHKYTKNYFCKKPSNLFLGNSLF